MLEITCTPFRLPNDTSLFEQTRHSVTSVSSLRAKKKSKRHRNLQSCLDVCSMTQLDSHRCPIAWTAVIAQAAKSRLHKLSDYRSARSLPVPGIICVTVCTRRQRREYENIWGGLDKVNTAVSAFRGATFAQIQRSLRAGRCLNLCAQQNWWSRCQLTLFCKWYLHMFASFSSKAIPP